MLLADGRGCKDIVVDIEKSEKVRQCVQHCDLVFKVSYNMPMYVYTLLKHWAKNRERLDFAIDAQWKLVAFFAEQSGLSGAHQEGTCFVGLVYLSDEVQQTCAEEKTAKRSIPTVSDVTSNREAPGGNQAVSSTGGEAVVPKSNSKRQRMNYF